MVRMLGVFVHLSFKGFTMLSRAAQNTTKSLITLLLMTIFLLSSCAALDLTNPKAPTVELDSVEPQTIGSSVQRLQIGLLVKNPNRFDLHIQAINFTALVNGEKFAKGDSIRTVKIPALGEALLDVQVALGLAGLLSQASKLFTDPEQGPLRYGVTGTVTLENWPIDIPFNVNREISSPLQ